MATSIPTAPIAPVGEGKSHQDPPIAPVGSSRRLSNAPHAGAQPISTSHFLYSLRSLPLKVYHSASPTSHGPSKAHRTNLPTGPRAMQNNSSSRSLFNRIGGRNSDLSFSRNEAQINAVTSGSMNGMEMAMAPNPLVLQEMMTDQWRLWLKWRRRWGC